MGCHLYLTSIRVIPLHAWKRHLHWTHKHVMKKIGCIFSTLPSPTSSPKRSLFYKLERVLKMLMGACVFCLQLQFSSWHINTTQYEENHPPHINLCLITLELPPFIQMCTCGHKIPHDTQSWCIFQLKHGANVYACLPGCIHIPFNYCPRSRQQIWII